MWSSFLYLIARSFHTIQREEVLQREPREKVSPLCICLILPAPLCVRSVCPIVRSLVRSLAPAPLITRPLPPIPPFPLTCLFLPTSPHPINLPPALLRPSDTSARLSAHPTTSARRSDRPTASAHPSTSAHSDTPAHSLVSLQPSACPSVFVC